MEIVVPPNIAEALLGGGVIVAVTLGLLEWLKGRDWFHQTGDILILWSIGLATVMSLLVLGLGWTVDATFFDALSFGVASGIGASVLRDAFTGLVQSRQTVMLVDNSTDVNEAQLEAAIKELDDEQRKSAV